MPDAILTELVKTECLQAFDMRPAHVLEALRNPDQTDMLEQDGLILRIHSKRTDATRPPSYIIVVEGTRPDQPQVDFAIKAYADVTEGFDALSPTHMLEAIANRFGLELIVGKQRARFIWAARIPIQSPQEIQINSATLPNGHQIIQQLYIRLDQGPPMRAICALCHCIDTTEYGRWLRTHRR